MGFMIKRKPDATDISKFLEYILLPLPIVLL